MLTDGVDYKNENGVTTFLNTTVGKVYCEMSNAKFPDFTGENVYKTTAIEVAGAPTNLIAKFKTINEGDSVSLSLAAAKEGVSIYFDWNGDNTMTQYLLGETYRTFTAATKAGKEVKVYTYEPTEAITVFSMGGAKLEYFDGSKLTDARNITVTGAGLSDITLPEGSRNLAELSIESNNFTSFDLSKYPELRTAYLSDNKFTTLDLTKNAKLEVVAAVANELTEVKLDNERLWELSLDSNNLTEIDLSKVPAMRQLSVSRNKLESIEVEHLKNLVMLVINNNNFTFKTLPLHKPSYAVYYYHNQYPINAGKLTGPDGNEMDTEAFLASLKVINKKLIKDVDGTTTFKAGESIPFRVVTQKYGKGIVEYSNPCDAEGKMYIELDLAKPSRVQGVTIDGYIGVAPEALEKITTDDFCIAWAMYDSLELETEMGEVSFKLDSVTVSVEERKLRATWSPELAQDVSAFHNIDAEAELTAILSEQIAAEIDREILRDLRKAAPWQSRWDVNGWRRMAGYSTNYTQKDWNQELFTAINQISAQIHKATLRGSANFIVVSSEISALFNNLEYFHVTDASAESDQYNMGIEKVGSLNNTLVVYRDPYAPHWSMIIGHKGKSLLDTGYIYAPYVPMQLTPTMYNPFNFAPIKGICTRYAKKMVNNRYYGHIHVDGLKHWDINEFR